MKVYRLSHYPSNSYLKQKLVSIYVTVINNQQAVQDQIMNYLEKITLDPDSSIANAFMGVNYSDDDDQEKNKEGDDGEEKRRTSGRRRWRWR
jgi:hypothetical protein